MTLDEWTDEISRMSPKQREAVMIMAATALVVGTTKAAPDLDTITARPALWSVIGSPDLTQDLIVSLNGLHVALDAKDVD